MSKNNENMAVYKEVALKNKQGKSYATRTAPNRFGYSHWLKLYPNGKFETKNGRYGYWANYITASRKKPFNSLIFGASQSATKKLSA